jgi:AraC-like DNA-binding protein
MARAAGWSRRQFHRLALRLTGETPVAHQRRLRLDRAGMLLLRSGSTILAIALEVGFESHETFTRAFRRRFGVTPSTFRRQRAEKQPRSIQLGFALATLISHARQTR